MTIGDRIKVLRKKEKLTQAEFAEKIGLKATAIGMYENNQRNVSEQSIALIVKAFGVSEDWLRYGSGDIFVESDASIVNQLISQYHMSDIEARALKFLLDMPEEKRQLVAKAFFAVLDEVKKPGKKYDFPSPDAMVAESSKAYPDFTDGGDKT